MPEDVYKDFSPFYDLYVGDMLDDLPFYLDYARASRTPVLEIGAGSGRLTVPMAQAGIPMLALDVSRSMLEILESRLQELPEEVRQRVQIIEADACDVEMERLFDLIIVPFYTFNYFLTPEAQRILIERLRAHVTPSGVVLIDVFIPVSRLRDCPTGRVLRVDRIDNRTGNRVRGWNQYRLDTESQLEHRRQTFEVTQPDGTVTSSEFDVVRRYSFPHELEVLFSQGGFSIERVFAGYARESPTSESEQLMYVLRPQRA